MNQRIIISLLFLLLFAFVVQVGAEVQLSGSFTQGGLIYGKVEPGTRVRYKGALVRVSPDGEFIVGFGRDAEIHQTLVLIDAKNLVDISEFDLKPREYRIERINGISQQMMEPSQETLERVSREAEQAARARSQDSTRENYREAFIWSVTGRISGVYGSQRIFNGEPRRPHFGIDIAASTGTPVVAPAGGRVTLAHAGMFYSGATLIVDHGHGLSSSFLHLDKILVKEGDEIVQGQTIAEVGASGRVTGPHLDWRINWFQERLDPALLVPPMPGK
ncbi:MAG: peptidase M23 [Desulfuromonas sp.]|nr:MAG: peptidase M23 [Desulfuromonas sp.]